MTADVSALCTPLRRAGLAVAPLPAVTVTVCRVSYAVRQKRSHRTLVHYLHQILVYFKYCILMLRTAKIMSFCQRTLRGEAVKPMVRLAGA